MSGVFGGPSLQMPTPVTRILPSETPAADNKAAQEAADREKKKRQIAAAGRGSTILTSGTGVTDEGNIKRKKLGVA